MKVDKAERTIELADETVSRFVVWKKQQEVDRNVIEGAWFDPEAVFTNHIGEPLTRHNFDTRCKELYVTVGIGPISPYVLRHTAGTPHKQKVDIALGRLQIGLEPANK